MDAKKRREFILLGGAIVIALSIAVFMERQKEQADKQRLQAPTVRSRGP